MTEERMQSDGAIYTNNYKDNEKHPDRDWETYL